MIVSQFTHHYISGYMSLKHLMLTRLIEEHDYALTFSFVTAFPYGYALVSRYQSQQQLFQVRNYRLSLRVSLPMEIRSWNVHSFLASRYENQLEQLQLHMTVFQWPWLVQEFPSVLCLLER